MVHVTFSYHTGLTRPLCSKARLTGSWDASGRFSDQWTEAPMRAVTDDVDCSSFTATVQFDESQIGHTFRWGVIIDASGNANTWGIATEVGDMNSPDCSRTFILRAAGQAESYWLTTGRRFGAQKVYRAGATSPAIRFSIWAPNAQTVEVVFSRFDAKQFSSGYIDDDGNGIDTSVGESGAFPLFAQGSGIFATDLTRSPALADYDTFSQRLYMFRITNEQGERHYKTDLWSRNQVGRGAINPHGQQYTGSFQDLEGAVSCSVVTDPDFVAKDFDDIGFPRRELIPAHEFWKDEFTLGVPLPRRIEELIVYELHVASLAFGTSDAGRFSNALAFLDRLVDLGVNAVELLPVHKFHGDRHWGFGSSHFFCVQTSGGGGDDFKCFVRACHQRGIAVILDVIYNHFLSQDDERSEWGYDSNPSKSPEHNSYYWYEGLLHNYTSVEGGYVDNGSGGWTPRLWEENVRQMFTSSAATMIEEYHVDGLRVDCTDALHQNNRLHADGRPLGHVNLFGIKFLRELTRTVRFVKPAVFLIAEDHTGWDAMIRPTDQGGVGFDAVWYAGLYWKRPRRFEPSVAAASTQYSQRLDAAHRLLARGIRLAEAAELLSLEFGVSLPHAYRYVEEAQAAGRQPPVVQPSIPTMFEIPGDVFRQLRAYSAANGVALSEAVTQALEVFLAR
jgi:1,4-alpha-glucan branching enzyme